MAFCPHCGKRTGDQATRCAACGKEIKAAAAAGGGAGRFKGTMMMAAPVTSATESAPEPESAEEPTPVTSPEPAPPKPAAGSQKRNFGGTMVGGMVAPSLPDPTKQVPSVIPATDAAATAKTMVGAAPPGASDNAGSAPTEVAPAPAPRPKPAPGSAPVSHADPALPGDPMAHAAGPPAPAMARPRPPQAPALSMSHQEDRSGMMWLGIGFVGMLAIAGIGLLAAKLMGLL